MASSPLEMQSSSPIRRWTRRSHLGHGSFGRVSLAVNLDDGLLFAVKSTSVTSPSAPGLLAIESELSILSTLNSPRILSFLGSDISSYNGVPSRNLFLEYMEGGSVAEMAKKSAGGKLDECRIRRFTRSIVEGLTYLHEQKIVHCDIKGQNILIGSSGIKIADFGGAKRIAKSEQNTGKRLNSEEEKQKRLTKSDEESEKRLNSGKDSGKWLPFGEGTLKRPRSDQETAETARPVEETGVIPVLKGTPLWMAPEVLQGKEQGFPSDIWSLGCTVVEMSQGSPPWTSPSSTHSSLEHLLFKIACTEEDLPIPQSLSEECHDFLSKCLQRDPRLRWSASELLHHPFLRVEEASSSPSLDDQLYFSKQPQSSPRSTLDFLTSGRECHDDDDRCSDELQEDGDEDQSSRWKCGIPSSDQYQSKLISYSDSLRPPTVIPQDIKWITVRRAEEDIFMKGDKNAGEHQDLPFMTDSSVVIVKKGCEVNLDSLAFLLQKRRS